MPKNTVICCDRRVLESIPFSLLKNIKLRISQNQQTIDDNNMGSEWFRPGLWSAII